MQHIRLEYTSAGRLYCVREDGRRTRASGPGFPFGVPGMAAYHALLNLLDGQHGLNACMAKPW